jgi:hypothetical protein
VTITPPAQPRPPDPRRETIARLLNDRVGGNAEEFYRDGCSFIDGDAVLRTGSHAVGQCAREIESAVREVLVVLVIPTDVLWQLRKDAVGTKMGHRAQVNELVRRLELDGDADEVALWRELSAGGETKGLAAMTHRRAHLASPPIDDDMRSFWRRFESLLVVLLRAIEARFAGFLPALRELAALTDPQSERDLKRLNVLPNTHATMQEFFERATAGWLLLLDAAGYFDDPPQPRPDSTTGETMLEHWPAIDYLARLLAAPESQAGALAIVERIAIPHEFSEAELLKGGRSLRGQLRLRYVTHLTAWIASQRVIFLIGQSVAGLVSELVDDGDIGAAMELLETILRLEADPQAEAVRTEEEDQWFRPTPKARLNQYDYEQVVERGTPALIRKAPDVAFGLSLRLLDCALEFSERPKLVAEHEDLSSLWLGSLTDSRRTHSYHHAILQARATLDAARAVLAVDAGKLGALIAALDQAGWSLCRRIALHLLEVAGDPADVRARLLDAAHLQRDGDLPELRSLAAHRLADLPDGDRRTFVALIESRPPLAHYAGGDPIDPETARASQNRWRIGMIRSVQASLPADIAEKYAEALRPAPVQVHEQPAVTPLRTSAELLALGDAEIVEHLRVWKPSGPFAGPTMESQAGELRAAVVADPERFAGAATLFADLDPTYVRNMFLGVHDLVDKGKPTFDWTGILALASAALEYPTAGEPQIGLDRDPGWGWTHKEIADLLRAALDARPQRIPFTYRAPVWALIATLAEDARRGSLTDADDLRDALSASLNSTHGSALHAAVGYVTWVIENAADANGRTIAAIPEANALLERHVDPVLDSSIAARGAFGFRFGQLVAYDEKWVLEHRAQFFPAEPPAAARLTWQAYVAWNHRPAKRMLELFKDQYESAIARINTDAAAPPERVDADEALAQQLMHPFIGGLIGIDTADGLIRAFFDRAPARLRGHAMEFVGRILRDTGAAAIQPEHCERARNLWEYRRGAAATASLPERRTELEPFGYWFTAGVCDPEWMLGELLATLALTGSIEPDSVVMARLAEIAVAQPVEAVSALDLLTESPKQRWFVDASIAEIETILRAVLADARSRAQAERVTNRLVAEGHRGLAALLQDGVDGGGQAID